MPIKIFFSFVLFIRFRPVGHLQVLKKTNWLKTFVCNKNHCVTISVRAYPLFSMAFLYCPAPEENVMCV